MAEPCGVCQACVAIDEGRFIDLIEVDAASRTRVDDTRELLDNVQYAPTRGRFKVYLIDEVHMLSNHSFNALLKTLEEPPPHVKFLFATTDPQKLPVTVLSRCLQFNLKKLTVTQIQAQLERICAAESIAAEPAGLKAIARAADGSMRDALSLLDQGVAFGGGKVTANGISSMLGSIDRAHVLRMLDALVQQDGAALLGEVDRLDELAPDYGAVLDELLGALQSVAVLQLVEGPRKRRACGARTIGRAHVRGGRAALLSDRAAGAPRLGRVPRRADGLRDDFVADARVPAQREADGDERAVPVAATPQPDRPPAQRLAESRARGRGDKSGSGAPSPSAQPSSELARAAADAGSAWSRAAARGSLRTGCIAGGTWQLVLHPDKAHLNTQQIRARLEAALREHLNRDVRLTITPGTPPRPTPAEVRKSGENERMREARESIENDPTVKAVQAAFDAVLEPDSIRSTK